jgi:hypothetical protein
MDFIMREAFRRWRRGMRLARVRLTQERQWRAQAQGQVR